MSIQDTRTQTPDPMIKDVTKYLLDKNSCTVLNLQVDLGLTLPRATSLLDYGVDKGYFVQRDYLNYDINISQQQYAELFDKDEDNNSQD